VLRAGATVAAALAVPGCGLFGDDPPERRVPDPLAPLLAGTAALLGQYDAAMVAHPGLTARLTPIRQAHAAHAAELARLIGTPAPSPVPPGTGPDPSGAVSSGAVPSGADPSGADPSGAADPDGRGTLAALRAAEQTGRREAADACLSAPANRTALLGTLAAARASHAEALR
jgi:hypothetical protein